MTAQVIKVWEEAAQDSPEMKAVENAKPEAGEPHPDRVPGMIEEWISQARWEEILERFYPPEEKLPGVKGHPKEMDIRSGLAFALGHVKRFDEAIAELKICVAASPHMFRYHASLAYNAYNSLYAAKNREVFLSGEPRRERVELAHTHFRKAQGIFPDNVTNFYREGMLYKELEAKPAKAIGLFMRAISNWESLPPKTKEARHQERKNYIKSLYQAAGITLNTGAAQQSFELLDKCLAEDEKSGYLDPLFKFFALGKVRFALRHYEQAANALQTALKVKKKHQPADYVYELLGRTHLAMNEPEQGPSRIQNIPDHRRRPYVRWTEADLLLALGREDAARKCLLKARKGDRLSQHKTLIRLARLEFEAGESVKTVRYAGEAARFFREKWGNLYIEGIYWQALGALELGQVKTARKLASDLETHFPDAARLSRLHLKISEKENGHHECADG